MATPPDNVLGTVLRPRDGYRDPVFTLRVTPDPVFASCETLRWALLAFRERCAAGPATPLLVLRRHSGLSLIAGAVARAVTSEELGYLLSVACAAPQALLVDRPEHSVATGAEELVWDPKTGHAYFTLPPVYGLFPLIEVGSLVIRWSP